MSFSHFKEGNFKAAISELEKQIPEKPEESDNLEIARYYQSGCKDTSELLSKLESLKKKPFKLYNQSVLLYYKEQYGTAIKILEELVKMPDLTCEYLTFKANILLIESYLALDLLTEVKPLLSKLEEPEILSTTKEIPANNFFASLILGAWSEEKCDEDVSTNELLFVANILKCRFHLKQGESEQAKSCLNLAESFWARINLENYEPNLVKHLQTQQVVIKNYLYAQIAYTEGNMNATLQQLNQAQIEVLPLLGEKQSHPSCTPSREKLSHPIYHYNNLGCVHLRLGKPRLSRFYFTKALETLKPHNQVDTSKPLSTVTYHSSQRRADLLYNSALALLNSGKPKHALDCLQEICPLMQNKPLFWYRIAQCYVMIHLKNLSTGRREMISDVCQNQIGKKYYLPAKVTYAFKEEEDKESENPLEQAAMCLRNALSLCKEEDMKINFLLLLCYVCMNTQPQCALSAAQQLLHMEVTESQRFIASMYASEALLILGKPRQAIEYVSHIPKELKLKCHSTLSPSGAVFTEEVSSRFVQSINLSSAHLNNGNIPQAQQALNVALNYFNLSLQPSNQPSLPVPAAILNIAIYISLKLGNHSQAEHFLRSRQIYQGMQYNKMTEPSLNR
jgi:tetratricopeptide (TPR) repeat protein